MMELVNVIQIICFHFVKEGELMITESHYIFRDNEHQCQCDVRGTVFPSSINLWTGGREPETPTTHYWCLLISLLVLFDPISSSSPPWLPRPFGNSKIISSHAVIYSYCVPRPGQVIWRWKWAGTGGEFKSVTHFHLRFLLLLFFLPHMKVITQSLCPQLTTEPALEHCIGQACCSQGCPRCRIWTSIKIDLHISQPKDRWLLNNSWALEDAELKNLHIKKSTWKHFCSGKITQQCICSTFQSHCRHL